MGSLMHFLRNRHSRTETAEQYPGNKIRKISKNDSSVSSIFYLMNTLKLIYQTQYGQVTMEKLDRVSLTRLLNQLENDSENPLSLIKDDSSLLYIQICAVGWEKSGAQMRVRALPDAASVRFRHSRDSRFESQFLHHHPEKSRDDGISSVLDPVTVGLMRSVTVLKDLDAFFNELDLNNRSSVEHFGQQYQLPAENFSEIFTRHEQSQMQPFINAIHHTYNFQA